MLQPGTLFAHYELEAVAGSGGMGVVYRAQDLRLRRRVALKIIAPQLARDALVRERLNREATVAASVLHPNVVPVYEAGEHDETAYIATRWVDGVTLKDLVDREGPLASARAAGILEQVAGALGAAHDVGLIHRDVTPANVMLGDEDHAYLTDFGLTRRSTDVTGLTATGQLLGTLDYVAPEQIEGAPVDRRSDVYSLGCLGYFLLCGEPPFPRDGHAAKLYAHLSADYVPLAERNHAVPPALDAALRAAMAKAPSDRPATAAGFARLLHPVTQNGSAPAEAVHDEPPAEPTPPPPPASKPRRPRRRLEVALGVASALVLVAAAAALFVGLRDGGAGVETIQVGKSAASVSASDGRVLVAGGPTGTVTRLSGGPAGGVRREVVIGGQAAQAQETAGRLYVAGGRSLTILDNRTPGRDKRIDLPGTAGALSAQGGVAWVALRDRPALARVGRYVAPIALAHPAAAVQVAGTTVWVADGTSLRRFDAATGQPVGRPIVTRGRPTALAVAGRALWVVDARRRALLRLDARTGRTVAPPVPLPGQPVAVAADGREVWVASAGRNVASRIDARTGRPIDEVGVARGPTSVALTPSAAWVVSARGALTRIPR